MPLEFSDEFLSAYLDGELSPDEQTQVESQLATDPEARQLLDELRALSGEVRELPRYSAGSGFSHRVVQAALAAKAEQNGAVPEARQVSLPSSQQSSDKSHSDKARRGARLPVVLAGVAAVAAAVAIMVWAYNRPGYLPVPGPGTIAVEPVVPAPAAISQAAEEALARLRLAIPQEGEAIVLRIRLGVGQSPAEALDAAFAAAGLGTRQADDETTGAYSIATAYQNKLAEKIAGQSADATLAAADAVFVTCPLDMLEKAVASLASRPQSPFEISPLMSGRVVLEADAEGEQAPTGPPKPKHFAQRLAADQFRLQKSGSPLAEIAPVVAATLDATKPIRVLILVEQ